MADIFDRRAQPEFPRLADPLQDFHPFHLLYDFNQQYQNQRDRNQRNRNQRDLNQNCRRLPLHENLRFLILFILPVVASMVLIPYWIDPYTLEHFKTNFKVIVLSQQFCDAKPGHCKKLLDPNYGDLNLLKRKAFTTYDITYIRHYSVEIWDGWVLGMIRRFQPRKLIVYFRRLSSIPLDDDDEFWLKWDESMQLMLAMMNSMVFHTIKGLLVSRMWVFFIFGLAFTIQESWESVIDTLYNVLRSDINVY
jgi:hypothetical protein